jgi:Zn-dependent peptidase ImmA (M78 family)
MKTHENEVMVKLEEWRKKAPGGVWATTPVNLEEVGKYWGVKKVIRRKLDIAGLLYRLEEGGSIVFLKEDDPPSRQRFSLAHELGHIVMSDSGLPEISCRQDGQINKDLERCCDVIAAELLMPQQEFCLMADKLGWCLGGVNELARRFKISEESAAIRMRDLKTEPVLMSMWRAGQKPLSGLDLLWARPNEPAKRFSSSVHWKRGPDELAPIHQALQTPGVITGSCRVLMDVGGESKSKSFEWVQTEGLRIGGGRIKRVIGFHYLARKT